MNPSAHSDTFARDNLPPRSQWPELVFDRPELRYPPRLNCAAELLDRMVAAGHGERPAIWAPVDGKPVGAGKPGPVTGRIQEAFFGLFTGRTPDTRGWLEPV